MKRKFFIICLSLAAVFSHTIQSYGQDIYRLIDPVYGGRYGKSSSEGPPFLKFGSAQQYYHIADPEYDDHLTAVSNVFSSWNNAGSVQFSSSQSSGLPLEVFYSSYGSPGIVNPGRAYPADNNYILDMDNSYIELNTYHTWGIEQDLEQNNFDVETILVHEVGHIHGLAHPLPNSYTHDASAPIMAGGDNEYFWDHTARSLRSADIDGTKFLQDNTWVPSQYSTIQEAINNSFSGGGTIHVASGTYTEDISMKAGVAVIGAGQNATTINGTVTFNSDNSASLSDVKVTNRIKVYYSDNVQLNVNDASNDYIEILDSSVESSDITSEVSKYSGFYVHTNSDLDIVDDNGTITQKGDGVYLSGSSYASAMKIEFCQNNWDIYATQGCNADAIRCQFSSSLPGGSVYGNVFWDSWHYCGRSAKVASQTNNPDGHSSVLSAENKDQALIDYREAIKIWRAVKENLRDDRNTGEVIDPLKYESEITTTINRFKQIVATYPDSPYAISALGRIAVAWRMLEDLEELEAYMQDISSNPKFENLNPYALNALVHCSVRQKDYANAIEISDQIIGEFPDHALVAELIHTKGMLYKYHLNDPAMAEAMFKLIVSNYPDHPIALSAEAELEDIEFAKRSTEPETGGELSVQSYPNPFNPETNIQFTLPEAGQVTVKIFNSMGQEVNTLVNENRDKGRHNIQWNGKDRNGQKVVSGVYYFQIRFMDQILNHKMLLIK